MLFFINNIRKLIYNSHYTHDTLESYLISRVIRTMTQGTTGELMTINAIEDQLRASARILLLLPSPPINSGEKRFRDIKD